MSTGPKRVWSGVVEMTPGLYQTLARQAGDHLAQLRPYAVPIMDDSGHEARAVYVVTDLEGIACYAGQTMPNQASGGAAWNRMQGHLQSTSKAAEWTAYWVFPLADTTPKHVVAKLEAAVCARLSLPLVNRRWRRSEKSVYGETGA